MPMKYLYKSALTVTALLSLAGCVIFTPGPRVVVAGPPLIMHIR